MSGTSKELDIFICKHLLKASLLRKKNVIKSDAATKYTYFWKSGYSRNES